MQDLRRLLPASSFMQSAELEPTYTVDEAQSGRGGGTVYPQRLSAVSLGPHPQWGWMQQFGTATEGETITDPATDWHGIFVHILGDALPQAAEEGVPQAAH